MLPASRPREEDSSFPTIDRNNMRQLASAVVWRYFAIGAQFVIVLLIARRATLETAGLYFSLFGFVTVAYVAVGLGAPDGMVKRLPAILSTTPASALKRPVRHYLLFGSGSTLLLGAMGLVAALLFGVDLLSASMGAAWWAAYATVFMLAQLLIALGEVAWGSFIAYSSPNVGYALTLIPYLLLTASPSFTGMVVSALAGCGFALVLALWALRKALHRLDGWKGRGNGTSARAARESSSPVPDLRCKHLVRDGLPIACARFLQASLPWLPVWLLTAWAMLHDAATYAAASRLAVVVTALLAALRFGARPSIVTHAAAGEFAEIERMSRRSSLMAAVPPVLAVAVLAIWGNALVPWVLGPEYKASVPVLIALMFGVLAEAFGGLSDEILKMTGHAAVVLTSLAIASGAQLAFGVWFVERGAVALAIITSGAFAVQYLAQVVWLRLNTSISLWPGLFGRRRGDTT